jgi:hypothetical protein
MEPTDEQKKAILKATMEQFSQTAYQQEIMGKTWQTIGNAEAAKKCAEGLAENTKVLAELQKQLDALE